MDIRIRRAYDDPAKDDGYRVLVDRIWPRGVAKQDLDLDAWMKDIAPSDELRKWFDHDADKWDEFQKRYVGELDKNGDCVDALLSKVKDGRVTLVFGAKDEKYNQAEALRTYLKCKIG